MKCTNRSRLRKNKRILCLLLSVTAFSLSGCTGAAYQMPYKADYEVSAFDVTTRQYSAKADTFASGLCVITQDIADDERVDMSLAGAAVLVDTNNHQALYAKNAHERLYPASLTKVMTALVAIKNASLDTVLTATDAVTITESGAQLCGLKSGDTMTLDQALHILLMYSANDVAMLIAENIGGSAEHFAEMMNEEAKRLGATNTNFVNPHGLSNDKHYTTAYDLYLIFNEAIQYDVFNEIIHMTEYQTKFYDREGNTKELTVNNTNRFLKGQFSAPENVTIIGGKTGTTNAAGHCLILLSKDTNGAPYISVILNSKSSDDLYTEMIDLLDEINK